MQGNKDQQCWHSQIRSSSSSSRRGCPCKYKKTFLLNRKHNLFLFIKVKAVNYPHLRASDDSWRSIMYESGFRKNIKKYHSPSNSSLVIELLDDKVKCNPDSVNTFSFPVSFSAVDMSEANVTVQVISRGQIMYAKRTWTKLTESKSTHIRPELLIVDQQPPITKGLFRGSFEKTVELPAFASPKAKV